MIQGTVACEVRTVKVFISFPFKSDDYLYRNDHFKDEGYQKNIFRHEKNKSEVDDCNIINVYNDEMQSVSPRNMICNESRIEINDDEYVDGFRDNLSSCVNKSGIKEESVKELENLENDKTVLIKKESTLCEVERNFENVEDFRSKETVQNETRECSTSKQTSNVNDGEMHGKMKNKTTQDKHRKPKRMHSRSNKKRREQAYNNTERKGQSWSILHNTIGCLFRMKISKKVLFFVLLILNGIYPTTPAAINYDMKSFGSEQYRLLITPNCRFRDIIKSETCHTDEKKLNTYINFCRFAVLCDTDTKPTCVDGEEGGMLHICSPKNLTCAKGYMRKARLDTDTDIVYVKEDKCPQGRYQPIESDCYHACKSRHGDLKDLPEKYSIFSIGTNISPTWIYCNFKKGFYNEDGNFLLAYNDEFEHYQSFCTSVSDWNPCGHGEYPLPNGTCVSPCVDGLKRNVHDEFKCQIDSSRSEVDVSTRINNVSEKVYPHAPITTTVLTTKTTSLTTQTQIHSTEAKEEKGITLKEISIAVIIAIVVPNLLICMLLIGIIVWWYRRYKKCKRKTANITRVREERHRTTVRHAENVHIYQNTTGRSDGISDGSMEMQRFMPQADEE